MIDDDEKQSKKQKGIIRQVEAIQRMHDPINRLDSIKILMHRNLGSLNYLCLWFCSILVHLLVSPFFAHNYRVFYFVIPRKILVWKSVDNVLYLTYDLNIMCVQVLGA
jgi:hypothetical protein